MMWGDAPKLSLLPQKCLHYCTNDGTCLGGDGDGGLVWARKQTCNDPPGQVSDLVFQAWERFRVLSKL